MAENTGLKDLQATVTIHSEEIHRLSESMEARLTEHTDRMDQIQRVLQQNLLNTSPTGGSHANSGTSIVAQEHAVLPVKDISLGFPHFDGSTPVLEWIFKAEKFFNYHNTPDVSRVDIAAMHFDKDVVPWFQMLHRISTITTWLDLTRALESQFGHSPYDCPMAELFKLSQTCSLSYYYLKFMALANRSIGLNDEALLDCFVGGLDKEIRRDVIAMAPPTLLRVVALARLYEERYTLVTKAINSNYTHKYFPITAHNSANFNPNSGGIKSIPRPNSYGLLPTPMGPSLRYPAIKKISPAEMQLRREKGQMLFLQLEDGNDALMSSEVQIGESEEEHAIDLLVDGGSSDNFLQPRVAKFLKLQIEPAPRFKVMVGNVNYMNAEGLIQHIIVHAQGNSFHLHVFLLPIYGANLIIGTSWLKTIGPHIADYEVLQLKFLWEGRFTSLKGELDLTPVLAELPHLRRMVHTNSIAEIYSMQVIEQDSNSHALKQSLDAMPLELTLLLQQYNEVFPTPVSIPPSRYPHSQKEEIERLVREMLTQGIIQPSKSLFSSPIILVKKKDGSWRVCTDYKALNAITIKDSFPIPTVDELIDELFGACFFSKFDIRSGYHQILLNHTDRFKIAFRTHHGHYECSSWQDHLFQLEIVLQILQTHKISPTLARTYESKATKRFSWADWYCRRFIKHYASIAAPLSDLLKKDSFKCSQPASVAFFQLKQAMMSAPVLAAPNFKAPFILETDAFDFGIGAVLSQDNHLIAFLSKKLSPMMQKQSTYAREFFAITKALAKFRHYLLGHKFVIKTYQKRLKELLEQSLQTPEQQ
ncbi:PREDICTED: uncharacterized protein LOC109353858 [Lupinus angustifolius]|uniref:uncharacterized protein LOC109353858 n=1 Tax=Lupinus angustifolius TaxID=3871 RepID=UPI00092EC060|nr:PREDICTED: uncharacterized protein LOC109353858 [Lupinus angustifolius]